MRRIFLCDKPAGVARQERAFTIPAITNPSRAVDLPVSSLSGCFLQQQNLFIVISSMTMNLRSLAETDNSQHFFFTPSPSLKGQSCCGGSGL